MGDLREFENRGLLDPAIARPRQVFAYTANANIVELAAAYTAGIVRNHPFADGDKRTGYSVAGPS